MDVADVPGINMSGLIFDAGPASSSLLQIGTAGLDRQPRHQPGHRRRRRSSASAAPRRARWPRRSSTTATTPSSTTCGSWRADHGAGAGGWTGDQSTPASPSTATTSTAYGLAVEHFQKYETVWNGQDGTDIFFQNENPYEVPSQAVWMSSATQDGYPAFYLPSA